MNVAIIGAAGRAGSRIQAELLRRGHAVTAIVRDPAKVAAAPGLTVEAGDANDGESLALLLAGHDAVVSAVMFLMSDAGTLIGAVKRAGVPRYLVVGGAGSLEVAPGVRVLDLPEFPEIYKAEATRGAEFFDRLKTEPELNWTFLSPSAEFVLGERTGVFRLGDDSLLADANGRSWISYEDFAVALVDEIETPAHERKRFTVGY
ncbi:3-beta hydroxysteroid dehydrogenase [Azospirillum thiophilum]|uniref:3-beta hydroxysteroid dehydrogenase n=1 Tax=Azospirillum thiophilum TaxID=528244 RepID=A0AAC8VXE5_9PROT|nr:NAD(P)-dependent oxidoreductase [Azospirillum thiophilum]ALG71015.1 3-beta hydroxysteroid dehydrogenase [Azospirillum thiophilum]KJR65322.1 3-beta hydroxysteroid dehydrogenase [Azospirillum thiophilum]